LVSRHHLDESAVLREIRIGARCETEAARPSLTGSKLRDTHLDAAFASFRVRGVSSAAIRRGSGELASA
jgi:hypothetical protein